MEHRTRVYVAGPYNSDPGPNTERAIEIGQALLDLGYAPFVPHLSHFWHERFANDHETWMELDLPWVAQSDCVYRIPGESKGADEEVQLARRLGIPVFQACCNDACGDCLEDFTRNNRVRTEGVELKADIPQPVSDALGVIEEIFGRKNADYAADSNWRSNFADVASQMDWSDLDAVDALIAVKQARLKSLRINGRAPANEAVADTYLDRAVYAVIALAMLIEDGATS